MELKSESAGFSFDNDGVLIEPLWNWNMKHVALLGDIKGLNRTFMELKLESISRDVDADARLNRTFMELKLEGAALEVAYLHSS